MGSLILSQKAHLGEVFDSEIHLLIRSCNCFTENSLTG